MKETMTIALFGAAWGFLEATVGGILHYSHVPYAGTMMSSIGFALLYAAIRSGVKPGKLVTISLVAASFKFLDAWLFPIAIFDASIINPAIAISSQGLAAFIVMRSLRENERVLSIGARMFAATAIYMIAFNAISLGVLGLHTNHTKMLANALLIQLPATAIISTSLAKLCDAIRIGIRLELGWRTKAALASALSVIAVITRVSLR